MTASVKSTFRFFRQALHVTTRQAPEIFQLPLDALNRNDLPSRDDPSFDEALITRYALEYAAKGWSAAVVVSDGFLRVVAVPQQGIEPKAYLLGLLQHGYIEDALPGLEAMFGMLDDIAGPAPISGPACCRCRPMPLSPAHIQRRRWRWPLRFST